MLLNELNDLMMDSNKGSWRQQFINGQNYFILWFYSQNNPKLVLLFNIYSDIKAKSSKEWIDDAWENNDEAKPYYVKNFINLELKSDASLALLRTTSLIYYVDDDFSLPFVSFVSSFIGGCL